MEAVYCYDVWLKTFDFLSENGAPLATNADVAPSDSLDVGLAALLSGVSNHYALDIVRFSSFKRNLKVFEELVACSEPAPQGPAKG